MCNKMLIGSGLVSTFVITEILLLRNPVKRPWGSTKHAVLGTKFAVTMCVSLLVIAQVKQLQVYSRLLSDAMWLPSDRGAEEVLMVLLGCQGAGVAWGPLEVWLACAQVSTPHLVWAWVDPLISGNSQDLLLK